jgi:hypothetical protein
MNLTKMLGLLAVAAAATMAIAAPASATTLISPPGTIYTGTIKAHSTHLVLHGVFTDITCETSEFEGKVEQHGNGVTVRGKLSTLDFTRCNFPVKVLKAGSLELHANAHVSPGVEGTGTVTLSGTEITMETSIANCIWSTSSTDLGTFTGTDDTKGTAVLDINSASIPRTGHSIFCGSSGQLTGAYTFTAPDNLWLDVTV